MKSRRNLLGILAGTAVGAALGFLFAPEKGKETRRKIAKKSEDYAGAAKHKFDELLGDIADSYEKAIEGINGFAKKGKMKVEQEIKNKKR